MGPSEKWRARNIQPLDARHFPTISTLISGQTVAQVNEFVNQSIRYMREDGDHWQQPSETMDLRAGDCEDFAILKRAMLLALGWADESLLVVIAYDILAHEHHAMLLVYLQGKWLMLDNRTNIVQDVDRLSDYRPVVAYSNGSSYTFGMG